MLTVCNSEYYALLKNLKQGSSPPPLLSSAFLSTLEYFHNSHSEDCEKGCGSWPCRDQGLHCTTVLFTDYYSELSGYRGFTKEVLFLIVTVLRIIMPILRTFPAYPYSQTKCGGVAFKQKISCH